MPPGKLALLAPLICTAPILLMPVVQKQTRMHHKEMVPIMAVIALIPLLLLFEKRRRTHHKDLELIDPETPPPGEVLPAGVLPARPQTPITDPNVRPLNEIQFPIVIRTQLDKPQIVDATGRPKRRSRNSSRRSTKPKPSRLGTLKIVSPQSRMIQVPRNLKVVGRQRAETQRLAGSEKATRSLEAERLVPRMSSHLEPTRP